MKKKVQEKKEAINLRRQGYTYNEILEKVPVAKSTLSNWLKDLPLTKQEKEYLKTRKNKRISRGRIKAAAAHRRNRQKRERKLLKKAESKYEKLKSDPFFIAGIALYWGEGTKRSNFCSFMNSELAMIKTFVSWLEKYCGENKQNLSYRLYIHKHYKHEQCEKFWAKHLVIPVEKIKISYKPDNKKVKIRPEYRGCFRVRVPKSKNLLFQIKVWQNKLAKQYK